MRVAGWILLILGIGLCLSVHWAPLGFLLLGIGLLSLLVAEHRRRQAKAAAAAMALLDQFGREPATKGAAAAAPAPSTSPPLPAPPAAQPASTPVPAYDKEAWRRLVAQDSDLAQLSAVLTEYGPHYVEEFATAYLAAPEKHRLGAIIDGIIANALKRDRPPGPTPAADEPPKAAEAIKPPPAPPIVIEPTAAPLPPPAVKPTGSEKPVEAKIPPPAAKPAEVTIDPPAPPPASRADKPPVDDELSELIRKTRSIAQQQRSQATAQGNHPPDKQAKS